MEPFVELLKRHGQYVLHAGSLCVDGRGLLVSGDSGFGKSTLTLTLVRAGFDFLGDDMIFLTRGEGGLRALAFPDEIGITDETAGLFPELHFLLSLPKTNDWPKHQLKVEEIYPADLVFECQPRVLVFPRIANTAQSVVKSMDPDEAFLELMPNVLLTEARASQAHLDILAELVRECQCYRLETGHDFETLPMLLRDLLL